MSIKRLPPRVAKTSTGTMQASRFSSQNREGSHTRNGDVSKTILRGQATKAPTPKKSPE